jgi:hypothetical protein
MDRCGHCKQLAPVYEASEYMYGVYTHSLHAYIQAYIHEWIGAVTASSWHQSMKLLDVCTYACIYTHSKHTYIHTYIHTHT